MLDVSTETEEGFTLGARMELLLLDQTKTKPCPPNNPNPKKASIPTRTPRQRKKTRKKTACRMWSETGMGIRTLSFISISISIRR